MDRPELDPEILNYYQSEWDEGARIRSGINQVELIRTRELVERFLPSGSLRILDVGGADGVHAEWLLDVGHRVDLVDPVPRHVEQAMDVLGPRSGFTAMVGDGRHLEFEGEAFDAVLLLGPLYHLPDVADRIRCWREAKRVTKPDGVIFGAVISRFASLFSGLSEDEIFDPVFRQVMESDLATGIHTNPDGREYFTTSYFHRPDEARTEAERAGLIVDAMLGVEGITAWIPGLRRSWPDPEKRQAIIDAARAIENEPSLLGLGPHIMVVARRPIE